MRLESAVSCDPLRSGLQSPGYPSVPASMTGVHLSEGVSAGCPPGQLLFSLVTEPLLVGDTESQPCPSFVHHDGFPAHRPSTPADDVLAKDQPSPFLPLLVSRPGSPTYCVARAWGPSVPASFCPISMCPWWSPPLTLLPLSRARLSVTGLSALVALKAPGLPGC